ncbi:hypothetical protein [Nocardioides sp.]|uniref:hypothetical protein n=1 Tax=Nocardioides sp. TaxID=35761 RepID=UPI001A29AB5B|nr:hypothetical protein [Nocardioides sp.]MBJ7356394.1 hypothetical protein [Nocardioides sp.]
MYPIRIPQPEVHDVLARSALPDAPVVPDRPRRRPLRAGRLALASGLHAAARAVEPAPRRAPEVCA